VVNALLSAGADVNIKDNNRLTPLHMAAQSPEDQEYLVQLLLDARADVESTTPEEGLTSLHLAAASHNPRIAATILEFGADIRATTALGETALHYAVETGDADFVTALCQAGAVVSSRSRRGTPLQLAERGKETHIVKVLTQYSSHQTEDKAV